MITNSTYTSYPFGMVMPGRHGSSSSDLHRYGMSGMEMDNEVSGDGNSYTAEFWQYSPRIGRRWNIDPIVKVHESPYACFANNPLRFIDPSGADTLDLVKVNKGVEKLEKMAEDLDKEKQFIEELKATHEKNVEDVVAIGIKHELSKKASKGNKIPIAKEIVEMINTGNSYMMKWLPGALINEAAAINTRISIYNGKLKTYNYEKAKIAFELATSDHMSLQSGKNIYTIEKNKTKEYAAVRYDINGKNFRFGKTSPSSPAIFKTLPSLNSIEEINIMKLAGEIVSEEISKQGELKK